MKHIKKEELNAFISVIKNVYEDPKIDLKNCGSFSDGNKNINVVTNLKKPTKPMGSNLLTILNEI